MDTDGTDLKLSKCDAEKQSQKWIWSEIHYQ
jgi:hypothetical protein